MAVSLGDKGVHPRTFHQDTVFSGVDVSILGSYCASSIGRGVCEHLLMTRKGSREVMSITAIAVIRNSGSKCSSGFDFVMEAHIKTNVTVFLRPEVDGTETLFLCTLPCRGTCIRHNRQKNN